METRRLYLTPSAGVEEDTGPSGLIDPEGRVRALVLGLSRPADWAVLAPVWQGVQADLGLPAPAIAVGGQAGLQLWFSLDQPVPAGEARAFLEALRRHHLADTAAARVALWPQPDGTTPTGWRHADLVPAPLPGGDHWSAFVAQDLAAVFAEEPWLDVPPSVDGQAQLLSRMENIRPGDFSAARARLEPAAAPVQGPTPAAASSAMAGAAAHDASPTPTPQTTAPVGALHDPRQFLLQVMSDETVPMALRIEAAKALLVGVPAPTTLKD